LARVRASQVLPTPGVVQTRKSDAPKLVFGLVEAAGGALVGLVALVLVLGVIAQLSMTGAPLPVGDGPAGCLGHPAAVGRRNQAQCGLGMRVGWRPAGTQHVW
jgi:hypothetical protein